MPTYEVTRRPSGIVVFDCPCGERHIHGGSDLVPGVPEHRAAHCADKAMHPFGYYIVLGNEGRLTAP